MDDEFKIIAGFIGGILILGFCIRYLLNFWLSRAKKTLIQVPYVPCFLAGFLLGLIQLAIHGNFNWLILLAVIVTWAISRAQGKKANGT